MTSIERRERYATDAEYAQRERARKREWYHTKYATDPEWAERKRQAYQDYYWMRGGDRKRMRRYWAGVAADIPHLRANLDRQVAEFLEYVRTELCGRVS